MTVLSLPARLSHSGASSHRARKNPAWAGPSLLALLALTLVLYLWDLGRNGYANDFYAAAVQAGTKSWKAFFFGSFDSSNFITVDKTPASLWVMEISARIFGFSSWSMLVPQAVEGVASVAILYAAVKRWFGPAAGLLAGLVLALTPVAALMFRFNNPDALLVLLMTAAGYAMTRAIERDRTRWLVLAGFLLGLAFLAKMMQAFLVIPGFGLAYLWAGPARVWRRLWQLAAAVGALIAGAGWWVLIAQLTPAADRPYFGGSANNNILQLALGYNGLGRLDGTETGSVGPSNTGGSAFGGATGIFRLFNSEFGGQITWLLPAALLALVALLWVSRRAARTDRVRAFALLWGGWLLVTGVTFSYMQGIIHPYYMVALAPAIAALAGAGAMALWQTGLGWLGRGTVALGVAVTAWWSFELLNRTPTWLPWLRLVIVVAGVLAVAAIMAGGIAPARRLGGAAAVRALSVAALGLSLVAGLAGPLAYSLETVGTAHTGAIPSAGPQVAGAFGGPGRGGFPGGGTRTGRGFGGFPGGAGFPGGFGFPGGTGPGGSASSGTAPSFPGRAGFAGGAGAAGGMGGLSGKTQVDSALIKLLETGASKYTWIAATEGSQEAAPIELATGGDAVMAIGGFNGTDPAPTLAEFEALVAKHEIHYYLGRGSDSFGGGTGSSAIASWVAAHFKSETVGGTTVYDLTQPKLSREGRDKFPSESRTQQRRRGASMETWDAIRARRNVRVYTPDPIPEADLLRIAEAGWRAPSASNRQHWEFVIVTDRPQLESLSTVWRGARHIAGAAAALALVIPQYDDDHARLVSYYDLGQATYAIMLAATDLGVGTGHSSVGDQEAARSILGVPSDHDVAFLIGLGYPADRPLRPVLTPNRRPFDEVVRRGHW